MTVHCFQWTLLEKQILGTQKNQHPPPPEKWSPFSKSSYKNRLLHVSLEATLGNLFSNLFYIPSKSYKFKLIFIQPYLVTLFCQLNSIYW